MKPRPMVDPRTGVINFAPLPSGVPMGPAPMRGGRAFRARGGLGNIPNASGAAGPLIPVYSEVDVWNPPVGAASDPAQQLAASTAPTPDPGQTGYMPMSAPFGESDRRWTNPTTFGTVPLTASTATNVPVLAQNYQRNALIIQNLSTATAPDVAPTLYVNFNATPIIGGALGLPPGVGIVFDIICPRDAIFVAYGPQTNGGGTVKVAGTVVGGTYSP